MASHSSVLAWRILGTGEPVGCRLWSRTESDTTEVIQQQQQQQPPLSIVLPFLSWSMGPQGVSNCFTLEAEPIYLLPPSVCMYSCELPIFYLPFL